VEFTTIIRNGTIKVFQHDGKNIKEVGFLTIDPDMDDEDALHLSIMLRDLTPATSAEALVVTPRKKGRPNVKDRSKKQNYQTQAIILPNFPPDPKQIGRIPIVPRLLMLQTLFTTDKEHPVHSMLLLAQLQEKLDLGKPKIDLTMEQLTRATRQYVTRGEVMKVKDEENALRTTPASYYITDSGRKWYLDTVRSLGYGVNDHTGEIISQPGASS
jgi:hypothetical protein